MSNQIKSADAQPQAPASNKEASPETSNGGFDPQGLVGRVLDGRYELIKCVGRGGMGVVYLARQSALGRDVVVKVLPPSFADDADALARFEREARGMSKLQHPHIVSIYDFGNEDGQTYIVMEYVEGLTLRRYLHAHTPMVFPTFGKIALQLLEGIAAAHAMGLVHRDIKPANIMLSKQHGEQIYVKILDFGLAKLVKGAQDVTKDQGLVGSVGFLSPEQILGNPTDERVDVYALGVLFYYMLAGVKPFVSQDDDVAVLYQHVHTPPKPLGEHLQDNWPDGHHVPQSIIDLIHRALAKSPAERPKNAGEFLHEFIDCLDGTGVSPPHISGTFGAVSRSGVFKFPSPDDPSTRFDRQRQETPFHQVPSHATPSHSGLLTLGPDPSSSSQISWVTGEHLRKVEQQNRTRNILLAVLGLLLIGVAVLFVYRSQNAPKPADERAEPTATNQPTTPLPDKTGGHIARGTLKLDVKPQATITLDGVLLGETPISQEMRAGKHRLEIRREGWDTIHRDIEIQEDTTLQLALELIATPDKSPEKPTAEPAPRPASKSPTRPAPKKPSKTAKTTPAKPEKDPTPAKTPEPEAPGLLKPTKPQPPSDLLPTSPTGGDDDLLLD